MSSMEERFKRTFTFFTRGFKMLVRRRLRSNLRGGSEFNLAKE